jgi:hypothetical protein
LNQFVPCVRISAESWLIAVASAGRNIPANVEAQITTRLDAAATNIYSNLQDVAVLLSNLVYQVANEARVSEALKSSIASSSQQIAAIKPANWTQPATNITLNLPGGDALLADIAAKLAAANAAIAEANRLNQIIGNGTSNLEAITQTQWALVNQTARDIAAVQFAISLQLAIKDPGMGSGGFNFPGWVGSQIKSVASDLHLTNPVSDLMNSFGLGGIFTMIGALFNVVLMVAVFAGIGFLLFKLVGCALSSRSGGGQERVVYRDRSAEVPPMYARYPEAGSERRNPFSRSEGLPDSDDSRPSKEVAPLIKPSEPAAKTQGFKLWRR